MRGPVHRAAARYAGNGASVARVRQPDAVSELVHAVDSVPQPSLFEALRRVAARIPLAMSVDLASIRLADDQGKLHLVAASGCPSADVRSRALNPLDTRAVQRAAAAGALHDRASALGIRWLHLDWIGSSEHPIGTILLGARTEREAGRLELDLLRSIGRRLAGRLVGVERTAGRLHACALQLARSEDLAVPGVDEVARLRPREREVLELYAEGLQTAQIAELLFLSEHTVRTHVKSALRTLGVHKRAEAARLVHVSQTTQLP